MVLDSLTEDDVRLEQYRASRTLVETISIAGSPADMDTSWKIKALTAYYGGSHLRGKPWAEHDNRQLYSILMRVWRKAQAHIRSFEAAHTQPRPTLVLFSSNDYPALHDGLDTLVATGRLTPEMAEHCVWKDYTQDPGVD